MLFWKKKFRHQFLVSFHQFCVLFFFFIFWWEQFLVEFKMWSSIYQNAFIEQLTWVLLLSEVWIKRCHLWLTHHLISPLCFRSRTLVRDVWIKKIQITSYPLCCWHSSWILKWISIDFYHRRIKHFKADDRINGWMLIPLFLRDFWSCGVNNF